MKCPYCDYENKETSKFCENCGAKLIQDNEKDREKSKTVQTPQKPQTMNANRNYNNRNQAYAGGRKPVQVNGPSQGSNMYNKPSNKKNSKIGIAVLILGFLGLGAFLFRLIAIGLGIYDFVSNKDKKHDLTIIGLLLVGIGVVFSLSSMGRSISDDVYNNKAEIESVDENTKSQTKSSEKTNDNTSVPVNEEKTEDTIEQKKSEEDAGNEKSEQKSQNEPKHVQNEFISSELFNDHGVSISSDKIEYGEKQMKFSFVLENTSDTEYNMSAHAFAVNGVMAGGSQFGSDLPLSSNSKARLTCTVDNEWLEMIGATAIDRFDVIFWAYGDTMKEWSTDVISVPIEVAEKSAAPLSELIYEDDFTSVSVLDVNSNSITYYVQNHSGYYASSEVTDCSVDGWAYDLGSSKYDLFNELVFNDCATVLTLKIDKPFLEECGIESPNTVNLRFAFKEEEPESFMDMWEHTTDTITVNIK